MTMKFTKYMCVSKAWTGKIEKDLDGRVEK